MPMVTRAISTSSNRPWLLGQSSFKLEAYQHHNQHENISKIIVTQKARDRSIAVWNQYTAVVHEVSWGVIICSRHKALKLFVFISDLYYEET